MTSAHNPSETPMLLPPANITRMKELRELLTRPIVRCNARHEDYKPDKKGELKLLPQCLEAKRHGGCLHLIFETISGFRLELIDLLHDAEGSRATAILDFAKEASRTFDNTIRDDRRHAANALNEERRQIAEYQAAQETERLSNWLQDVWDPLRQRIVKKIDELLQSTAVDQNAVE